MAPNDSTTGRAPAFQFYPNDFLSDRNVVVMSMQERGVYITLICHAWQSPLPADISQIARICGLPLAAFRKLWPALSVCFREQDGALIHPRLERERAKQAEYRGERSESGKRGAAKRWLGHGAPIAKPPAQDGSAKPEPMAPDSSSLVLSTPVLVSPQTQTHTRSRHPVFKGQRFVVFDWMLDDLARLLGPHTDAFDLHSWFYQLDQHAVDAGVTVPQRDGGKWLQDRTMEEASRRGLPVSEGVSKRTLALARSDAEFLRGAR